jgi:hypothetical protein
MTFLERYLNAHTEASSTEINKVERSKPLKYTMPNCFLLVHHITYIGSFTQGFETYRRP